MGASAPTSRDALGRLLDEIRRRHSLLMAASRGAERPATPTPKLGPAPSPFEDQRPQPAGAAGALPDAPASQLALQARLEVFGLLPEYAATVADRAARLLEPHRRTADAEWKAARAVLAQQWRPAQPIRPGWQVWLGPAGAGATTCLCKWLVRQAVQTGPPLRVWRLDLVRANTAEALTVIAEACGVPVHRAWPDRPELHPDTIHLLDLPGLDWHDPQTQVELGRCLARLPEPQVHLVLNAAYEVPVWLAQIRAFAGLPISDLNFSHLDEQPRWGKLWNAVLSATLPLGFLSAGQNVPGQWRAATLPELLPRQAALADAAPDRWLR